MQHKSKLMKIQKISVKNFKAIEEITLPLDGASVIVSAGNDKGKTSLLTGLFKRFENEKPSQIVRHGEKDGFYEMLLTDGSKFIWDLSKDSISYYPKENHSKVKLTKDIIAQYFSTPFDIDEFINSTPQKKFDMLKKVLSVNLSDYEKKYKDLYDDRTFKNRKLKELEIKIVPIDESMPLSAPDISELTKKLSDQNFKNSERKQIEDRIKNGESMVSEIEAQIIELEKKKNVCIDGLNNLREKLDQMPNYFDTSIIQFEIEENSVLQEKISKNNNAKKIKTEFDDLKKELSKIEVEIATTKSNQVNALKNAGLPEGFDIVFDDQGKPELLYEGFEISKNQLSLSKIYKIALKLGAHGLKECRSLHFDAAPLDKNSLQEIINWAKDNDLQLLIEQPEKNSENTEIVFNFI